jgi:hypothetical protein
MKETPRQQFRWAPHVSGAAVAKPKDYEPAGQVEAEAEYAAWAALRQSGEPLEVGDLLEILSSEGESTGALRICKYVGFEEARWFVPEQIAPTAAELAPVPQSAEA